MKSIKLGTLALPGCVKIHALLLMAKITWVQCDVAIADEVNIYKTLCKQSEKKPDE